MRLEFQRCAFSFPLIQYNPGLASQAAMDKTTPFPLPIFFFFLFLFLIDLYFLHFRFSFCFVYFQALVNVLHAPDSFAFGGDWFRFIRLSPFH
jgi:hypothetical protein